MDAKKRALQDVNNADNKLAKKARLLADAGRAQKGAIMNFARTGVTEAKRKAVVIKEAPKEHELDIDMIMDDAPAMQVGARPTAGKPMPKAVQKRAPSGPARTVRSGVMPDALDELNNDDYLGSTNAADELFDEPAGNDYGGDNNNKMDIVAPAVEAKKINMSQTKRTLKVGFEETRTSTGQDLSDVDGFKPNIDGAANNDMGGISSGSGLALDAVSSTIDTKLWIYKQEGSGDDGDTYCNFFYLDACETNGVVYLFGKVDVTDRSADPTAEAKYVSCCVAAHNCERNLFVLPKATGEYLKDGTEVRTAFQDVYGEINKMLIPNIIPKKAGMGFRCAKKKRNYAFEHGNTPRCPTDYLKVVYSAKFGAPTVAQCNGGEHYERIFGAQSSVLELFILKRKLKGPCWLKISKPRQMPERLSWCKLEIAVENPKSIAVSTERLAPPPLVSMAVSMKTAVNPHTHTHEVIAISGLVHTKVEADVDTEMNPRHMRRFTYVRPLGVSCGPHHPAQFPHDLNDTIKNKKANGVMEIFPNERAMLSRFFTRLQQEDPDIMSSHNLFGFEFDVLLNRALANKIGGWDRLGRLRRARPPKSINDANSFAGRILCDTYKAAKEFLRETTYSLTHLAESQLKRQRYDLEPVDVPRFFSNALDIYKLYKHTENDSLLVQSLMLKLQVIPLTKQLTNLSGNLWSRTMRGARAERIEYLLMHEFHNKKYVLPERKPFEKKNATAAMQEDDDEDGNAGNDKVGGHSRKRAKAAYQGGLVLEPKKGLYDTYILLLDFNSLYPSLIQEYNLCFTTVDYTKFMPDSSGKITGIKKESTGEEDEDEEGEEEADVGTQLAPLPDPGQEQGILPRVIKYLVDRRRQVKDLLKRERDPVRRIEHDIRQKALKLTANSMYGCLGFSFSRFYARPIAALVTAKGREALQRTVDLATRSLQLDVIYGDTDSVMINTNSTDLAAVKILGRQVTSEVNKLYKALELDIDGVFKSMLLLKKKKYAALTINERDGEVFYEKELKGLDLVRRDWATISKDTGKWVVDQILSGKPREDIVIAIHEHLEDLATKIRAGSVDLKEFIITKGLNKNPKDYPDVKGQPHLQVALQMIKNQRPVNIGDHIPYVICKQGPEGSTPAQRAKHPDDVFRSNGELTVDFEWYLTNQILPPISRLCEPIEGTSTATISEKLGLDASKFRSNNNDDADHEDYGFVPKCKMPDGDRFAECAKLKYNCQACGKKDLEFTGTFNPTTGTSGLSCAECGAMYLGRRNAGDCYSYLANRVSLQVRACVKNYYDCWLRCDDATCNRRTMQQSVMGYACTENCKGRMVQDYDEARLHTQLKYLECLFSFDRAVKNRWRAQKAAADGVSEQGVSDPTNKELKSYNHGIPREQQDVLLYLKTHMENSVNGSAYNWVRPSLWSTVFGKVLTK